MKTHIKTDILPSVILRSRGLGDSTAAQKHLALTVRQLCDPYVPMQQGTLKNTAQVSEDGSKLVYQGPCAHYQYYGEVMGPNFTDGKGRFWSGKAPKQYTGRKLEYHGAPMRGPEWDKRMMADRGDEVTDAVAEFVGGKRK